MPEDAAAEPLVRDAAYYQEILDAGGIGFWEYDHPSGTAVMSSRIVAMLGYAPGKVPGGADGWFSLVHPDDQPRVQRRMEAALAPDNPLYDEQFRMRCMDGQWLWVHSRGRVVARDSAGRPLRTVGLAVFDRDLRCVRINERMAEINGRPAADHLGRTLREILPDLADGLEPILRQVIAMGDEVHNLVVRGATAAQPGVERDWLAHYGPVCGNLGEIVGIACVVQEITATTRGAGVDRQIVASVDPAESDRSFVSLP